MKTVRSCHMPGNGFEDRCVQKQSLRAVICCLCLMGDPACLVPGWLPCFVPLTAAREVLANHDRMLQKGFLTEDPFWYFVMNNAGENLYQGYKISLYGLVRCLMQTFAADVCCWPAWVQMVHLLRSSTWIYYTSSIT